MLELRLPRNLLQDRGITVLVECDFLQRHDVHIGVCEYPDYFLGLFFTAAVNWHAFADIPGRHAN